MICIKTVRSLTMIPSDELRESYRDQWRFSLAHRDRSLFVAVGAHRLVRRGNLISLLVGSFHTWLFSVQHGERADPTNWIILCQTLQ